MSKNFVCIYCQKVHPNEFAMCPETDTPISPAHKLSFTKLENKYAINKVMGEGGMGVIYEGEHIETGKRVAIKFLNPAVNRSKESYERFQREARAATLIDHHNIVQLMDIGTTHNGVPYIVMEYLAGEDLGRKIESTRTFPLKKTREILSQVLETLASVHAQGIVHRDLKPENIFLVKHQDIGEFVKVLDFGIARLTTHEAQTVRLTTSGHIFGTPYYISPEQAEGEMDVDHRSDLYSAGVILFEILTGRLPFFARTFGKILLEIMTKPVPDPRKYLPDLSQATVDFLFTSMAKEPNKRFQSAKEMLKEFQSLDLATTGRTSTSPGRIKLKPTPYIQKEVPETAEQNLELQDLKTQPKLDMRTGDSKPPLKTPLKKAAKAGVYRMITPSLEKSQEDDEDTAPVPPPPREEGKPLHHGAAAKKEKARTLPESKSKVTKTLEQDQMTTPTPDRDDTDES